MPASRSMPEGRGRGAGHPLAGIDEQRASSTASECNFGDWGTGLLRAREIVRDSAGLQHRQSQSQNHTSPPPLALFTPHSKASLLTDCTDQSPGARPDWGNSLSPRLPNRFRPPRRGMNVPSCPISPGWAVSLLHSDSPLIESC
jgi:hypothetical protein